MTNIGDIIPIEELQKNVKEKENFLVSVVTSTTCYLVPYKWLMEEKLSVPSTYYIQPYANYFAKENFPDKTVFPILRYLQNTLDEKLVSMITGSKSLFQTVPLRAVN